jgi:hypothetical protein
MLAEGLVGGSRERHAVRFRFQKIGNGGSLSSHRAATISLISSWVDALISPPPSTVASLVSQALCFSGWSGARIAFSVEKPMPEGTASMAVASAETAAHTLIASR